MLYWLFKQTDGSCLAIEDVLLDSLRINADLGQLLCDRPVNHGAAMEKLQIHGGRIMAETKVMPLQPTQSVAALAL